MLWGYEMDSRHMRHFVALAETLHFGRAAARMNMSQPPFSRQIAGIESELGVKLVERNSRNVSLTPAGKRFLEDSRGVLAQFDAACRDAQLVASGMKGELRLGFTMHAAHGTVPKLVRRYSEARPHVRLILEETIPTAIDEMLVDGKLDAAVTFAPHGVQLNSVSLARDRLSLIVPAGHPLAARKIVGAADLAGHSLIAAPATVAPTLRNAISDYHLAAGVVPSFIYEPRLQHTIVQLVAEGLGIALVPETVCSTLAEGVVAVSLRDPPAFDIVLVTPAVSSNPAVAPLVEVARRLRRG